MSVMQRRNTKAEWNKNEHSKLQGSSMCAACMYIKATKPSLYPNNTVSIRKI